MLIRSLQVLLYIFHSFRLGAKPWKFFQLNAEYFNEGKGIFSKLDIDQLIPPRWRLAQYRDTGRERPKTFPVFVKPEWGQNSVGIRKAGSQVQLDQIRSTRPGGSMPYLIQEAASGEREFEVYLVPDAGTETYSILSVIETLNTTGEKFPVNGIHNSETCYRDMTGSLSTEQLEKIWQHLKSVGPFRIARFGIRANDLENLVAGEFHIFEINLFIPMPLVLLAENVSLKRKLKIMNRMTIQFARMTNTLPEKDKYSSVFFRKMVAHRENQTMASRLAAQEPALQEAVIRKRVAHKGVSL
ncbi:hypothetical protein [Parendozoicomonas sp. Alg238-R29]|uniref:hypothetical protein n=1 Tax=Parendozoicomonas sp. Alg238-R29 TaxID=2993446 RepID=UPI00248E868B|nr:hypothetical protein [Parendozoicomonas sp. Alg238-R29]